MCDNALLNPTDRILTKAVDDETPIPKSLDRSAPPVFIANNNVSLEGGFVLNKEGEPSEAELSNHNVIKIVAQTCTDDEVNWLAWKCLGEVLDAVATP